MSNVILPNRGFIPKANTPGTPNAAGDARTQANAQRLRKHETIFLTLEQARCAAEALVMAAKSRGWRILRAAIMASHAHVVIIDCPNNGPAVRRILKGTSQAALNDLVGHSLRWWTAGGSDRYENDWPAIEAAVRYVAEQPGMLAGIDDMKVFVVSKDERRSSSPPTSAEPRHTPPG